MRVGLVHTRTSTCLCAQTIANALTELGHEPLLFDSEEMEHRAWEVATSCGLVFDHTDTFRGRGLYRALVRLLLEARQARLVGSGSAACFLADDKSAAKARLAAAGVPTPPGIVVTAASPAHAGTLRFPLVVKPASEHMSRGLALVRSAGELGPAVEALLARHDRPVVVESYIPGRELAVPVVGGPAGPEVLPILEVTAARGPGLLTEAFKEIEFGEGRDDMVPADLDRQARERLESLALAAFSALGLRDYARFDVRLAPEGPFFLEANATPSMERNEAMELSAQRIGLDYPALVDRIVRSALRRYSPDPRP